MRKIIYIIFICLCFACDSENAGDCFQTTGAIIQQEFTVPTFDKILVNRDIELILKEGPSEEVIVETGKNLFNDVSVEVIDNQLILTDGNTCNYVRTYGTTKVYVTAPSITEVRSSTQYDIKSDGVLTYPNLTILSEDFRELESINTGNFYLDIDNEGFTLVFNNLSNAFISGKTNNLRITLASGLSRFEGRNLIAQNVSLSQRSSNDIIINPQQKLSGKISGVGDVISANKPPIVDVEVVYKGQLIFE
jgi:hypothetical protein